MALSIDVHVAPMRAFRGPTGPGFGDRPTWSPMSSTLIAGDRDAVLVDTLVTYDQVDALADWVEGFGKRVVAVLITHGHSDHWIGLARLRERFPDARGLATREVLAQARFEVADEGTRAYWQGIFPGEVPAEPVLPELLDADSFDLDGQPLRVVDIGQGDVDHSSIVHAPSIDAVVAGDVVYNQVHMMTADTDEAARAAWLASLDAIAALRPKTVVSGHKRVGAPDSPDTIEQSSQYLRDFSHIVATHDSVDGVVAAMLDRHGDRDNPRTLWHSARQVLARTAR
ncbi:MBL fold metallo-hydrolase [Kutzneria buriramensis]|uniref:Glyoxylase-like metal-dependent hydrolase (Beta-lactamase superfamily II) n=1 Tax=Kutzneria buriramensis TaxID=1045776 RepID=A0A3E0G6W7_9PSEU|nr:MBL fold metallo-hydrolase [Kutzneria buriramensis]REH17950.1 glyoxylase-like metal-dependent hydrolase (beta-lactamase superfamily II) [Kutzneria buriramensis]